VADGEAPWTPGPHTHAASFWPAHEADEFVGGRPIAGHPDFAIAAIGKPPEHFLAVSDIDVIIVGVRSDLEQDLRDPAFVADEYRGALIDTVRPRELVGLGQHHRSAIIASSSDPDVWEGSDCHGPAIFDNAAGYLRLRDSIEASTNIVILDRWHPRSEEAAAVARMERNETWVQADSPCLDPVPPGVEVYVWTEDQ
jgi:hypothetical protein